MAIEEFEKDSVVKLRGQFKTPKDATPPNTPVDPATVTLTIRRPDKTIEVRTFGVDAITKDSTGIYSSLLTLAQEGTYHWRWQGSNGGTSVGVLSGLFDSVRRTDF
jgi:hypothetical protein